MAYPNGGYGQNAATGYEANQARDKAMAGAMLSGQEPSTRLPLVLMEMQGMMEHIDHLTHLTVKLEDRLASVLSSHPQTATEAAGKDPTPNVALAGAINEMNSRLGSVTYRLGSILDRIEL